MTNCAVNRGSLDRNIALPGLVRRAFLGLASASNWEDTVPKEALMKTVKVAVLGASPNPERYSNRAIRMLKEHGHEPIPVRPAGGEIEGLPVYRSLNEVRDQGSVHTLTMYVNAGISSEIADQIWLLAPLRIIFNPGSENPEIAAEARRRGIEVVEACTLVMLRTGQF